MKKILFVLALLCPCFAFAQLNVRFSDDSIPSCCSGTYDLFSLSDGLLTSSNVAAGESYLFAPSTALSDTEWRLSLSMTEPTNSCFARFYLANGSSSPDGSSSGYFLRVGDSKRQISLCFCNSNGKVVTLATSDTMRLRPNSGEKFLHVDLLVARDAYGLWTVSSKLNDELSFSEEFSVVDTSLTSSSFSGIYCKYPKSKANTFSFSDWSVVGEPALDEIPPRVVRSWFSDSMFFCEMSEPVSLAGSSFWVPDGFDSTPSYDPSCQLLSFSLSEPLHEKKRYEISLAHLSDFSGNLLDTAWSFGLPSEAELNDLIFTEIMFAPLGDGAEFVEVANVSDKVLDLSTLSFASRKMDASPNYGKRIISSSSLIFPGEYRVLTKSPEKVCALCQCPGWESFVTMPNMPAMNNSGGCVSLYRLGDSLLVDEACFSPDMHVEGVPDKGVGVSLERVSLDGSSWSSASPVTGYASPGVENQAMMAVDDIFFDADRICSPSLDEQGCWHLRYSMDKPGYLADVRVFSLNGTLVATLARSSALSVVGELLWDGRSDGGALVPPTVYVVVVEAIHPRGDRVKERFVVLVSR